jgi:hypothetical protein
MLNNQGRPTAAGEASATEHPTFTGNRALIIEEALLFEIGRAETTGVDVPTPKAVKSRLGGQERKGPIGLVGLSEPETMRHFVRLSQKNYGIDTGLFPLGSCTMKHNPRLNEKMARLPGFADIHPLQPQSTVQGALELIELLAHYLMTLTGTEAVAMSPKAGAHGELCGMMAIKAAIEAKGEAATRRVVLVPDSAHGTNPATAALIGFEVKPVPARADGTVHVQDVKKLLGPDVAAIMLTNPNTCGIFEPEIVEIARAMKKAGAYFYCDGANFNAIVGKAKPGDLGVDCMHINLHKTFSRPRAGCALEAARAFRAGAVHPPQGQEAGTRGARSGCRQGAALRARHGFPWADGDVCARAGLYAEPWRRWHEAGLGRCGALGELHPCRVAGSDVRALPGASLDARSLVRRYLAQGYRHHHARFRESHDRRGLPPHDHVFPARGAWRDAGRADRIRKPRLARSLHHGFARSRDARETGRNRALHRRAIPCAAPATG